MATLFILGNKGQGKVGLKVVASDDGVEAVPAGHAAEVAKDRIDSLRECPGVSADKAPENAPDVSNKPDVPGM